MFFLGDRWMGILPRKTISIFRAFLRVDHQSIHVFQASLLLEFFEIRSRPPPYPDFWAKCVISEGGHPLPPLPCRRWPDISIRPLSELSLTRPERFESSLLSSSFHPFGLFSSSHLHIFFLIEIRMATVRASRFEPDSTIGESFLHPPALPLFCLNSFLLLPPAVLLSTGVWISFVHTLSEVNFSVSMCSLHRIVTPQ